MALHADGRNACEIARELDIPRTTVQSWIRPRYQKRATIDPCPGCGRERHDFSTLPTDEYAYLLGIYLGDGTVSKAAKGCFRLRVILDARYPSIVDECRRAIQAVVPRNVVAVAPLRTCAAVEVSAYSRQWPCLLPQHGSGRKHLRPIELTNWQRVHTLGRPEMFVRGLIHSDGCRSLNTVRSRGGERTYAYPRYTFCNRSADIKRIYCEHLDLLGIDWRRMNRWNISTARRESVAKLDAFVGPKR